MTQELVAQHMGVSRQAVSKWESGATEPSTTNLMELARLYGGGPSARGRGVGALGWFHGPAGASRRAILGR